MALETSPESPAPLRQIVGAISQWVERLGAVWVEGQVTQVNRRGGSNTVFLVLRDKLADVSMTVTCPRGVLDALPTPLVEGAQIVVFAKATVYPGRGSLSLSVREIRLVGEGELLARLERRRQLLAAEGLFDPALKRRLPFLPRLVGLVTGENTAAERDVLDNARRRWPGVAFEVVHATMQGPNSAAQVIEALGRLERNAEVDVVIVSRGGGSVEDLLPFSDEALVRAVFAMRTPVVSAIGHEPDQPILDLVADVRASTPTDAAKRVVPDVAEESQRVLQLRERGRAAIVRRVASEQQLVDSLRNRPALADPRRGFEDRLTEIGQLRDRGRRVLAHQLDRASDDLGHHLARVRALSPLATLQRGYAVLSDAEGKHLSSVAGLSPGDGLSVRVADGRMDATVSGTTLLPLPGIDEEPEDDE